MKTPSIAALTLVLACGGGNKPASTTASSTSVAPAAPAATPAGGDSVLDITDLQFSEGGKVGMHLYADGRLELMVHPSDQGGADSLAVIGTVTADGTFTSARDHKSAHFHADGTLEGPDGKLAPFKIEGDSLAIDGKHLTIDDKGEVLVDGTVTPLLIQGVTTPKSKRTALVLASLILGGKSEPAAGSSAPAAATPAN